MCNTANNPVLELCGVGLGYGRSPLLQEIAFRLERGQVGCLLGKSGTGKTTLLRGIAGLEPLQAGTIRAHGKLLSAPEHHTPPERRNIGLVFQEGALFPHLSVAENIAFGLTGTNPRQRVAQLAELLGLSALLARYPHEISGGQQQRVALARAAAPCPSLLLLDEPFANLDPALREHLAGELRRLFRQDGITALMASHNQEDAFAMADRLGVLHGGKLLQWDSPFQVYHRPADIYVADFVGEGCLIDGTVLSAHQVETALGVIEDGNPHGCAPHHSVRVLIRPDDILHDDDSTLTATVVAKVFRGAAFLYTLQLQDGPQVYSLVPSHHDHPVGEPIGIRLEIDHLVVFPGSIHNVQT